MKKLLLALLLTAMLTGANSLRSAEIIPVWEKANGEGMIEDKIYDIEFLRGENQFILLAGIAEKGTIQIRETNTGELVSTYPLTALNRYNQIEITPDSNRCIITTGGSRTIGPTIELRNLGDYSLISKDTIVLDGDKDPAGNFFYYLFRDIIVDPVRPLVYVMLQKTNFASNEFEDRFYLKVYNYETMQLVKDLTPVGYETEELKCFDVSDDGKYLAALNDNKSYLKVWDLETQTLIKNQQLYDNNLTNPNDYRCEAQDIEFSSNDNDLIYYSGHFPNKDNSSYPNGVFKFSMSNNKLKLIELNFSYDGGIFTLFDDEKRIFVTSGNSISILNQELKIIEYTVSTSYKLPFGLTTILNSNSNNFIGYSNQYICSINYDSQTGVHSYNDEEIRISPNPTSSFININLNCAESLNNYQISDISGALVKQGTLQSQYSSLHFDFTSYPSGVYFLTINCYDQVKSYKIIKE